MFPKVHSGWGNGQHLLHRAGGGGLITDIWNSGLQIYCAPSVKQADRASPAAAEDIIPARTLSGRVMSALACILWHQHHF